MPGCRIRRAPAAVLVALIAACGPAAAPRPPAASSHVVPTTSTPTSTAPTTTAPQSFTVVAGGDVLIHQDLELTAASRSAGRGLPLHLEVDPGGARVVPADPAAFACVSAVVGARGAPAAGVQVVHG